MPAKARNTIIAGLIESFLDDNEDNLPPAMFVELEDLAGRIDDEVDKLEDCINDLKSDVENLEVELEELKND